MRRRTALRLCALLVLALPTGCLWYQGQFDPLHRGDSFDTARKRFTRLIRWSQFEKASEMVDPEYRAVFLAQASALRGVRFSDYEVLVVDVDDELRSASVDVLFRAYGASLVEKTVALRQRWTRDSESGVWSVRPELTELTRAFPVAAP